MSRFRMAIGAAVLAVSVTTMSAGTMAMAASTSSNPTSSSGQASPSTASPPSAPAVSRAVADLPANILVTDDRRKAYTSPWIAKDPTNVDHIAIAYMEGGPPGPTEAGFKACHLALTHDGGSTWVNRTIVGEGGFSPLPSNEEKCAQPAAIYGPDGTLYYLYTAVHFVFGSFHESIFITVSRDGGKHFSAPHKVDPQQPPQAHKFTGAGDERVKPAVDLRTGRLYLAWTRYSQEFCCGGHVLVASSNDHGATFSSPVNLDPNGNGELPAIAVGSDGAVFVDWNDVGIGGPRPTPIGIAFARSLDHGRTFSAPVNLAVVPNGCPFGTCYDANNYSLVPATNVGAGAVPGLVLVVWSSGTGDVAGATVAAQGPGRIQVLRSTDDGATFSGPQIVGVPPNRQGDNQHHPWLSFAPSGRVDLAYYDETPDGRLNDVFVSSSLDLGLTFGRPTKINSVPIDNSVGPPGPVQTSADNNYFNARIVDSVNGVAFVAWNDTRRGSPPNPKCFNFNISPPFSDTHNCIPKQDVMFARLHRQDPA